MKKAYPILILILIVSMTLALAGCQVMSMKTMMGTNIELHLQGGESKVVEREIYSMITRVENNVSTNVSTSTVSKINSAKANVTIDLDDDTNAMIAKAYEYYLLSDGAFDISVFPLVDLWQFSPRANEDNKKKPPAKEHIDSTRELVGFDKVFDYDKDNKTITKKVDGAMIDLGAIAKGYVADDANKSVVRHNLSRAIVNIGGTLYLRGEFPVGIKNPRYKDGEEYTVKDIDCKDVALSTSGDYERYYEYDGKYYHHIIDPKTGSPTNNGVVSVTIVSKSAMLADILSTTVFVLGEDKGVELLKKVSEIDSAVIMTLDQSGKLNIKEYKKGDNI